MKAEALMPSGGPVAKSLKITGSTRLLVAALAGAVSLNAAMAAQYPGLAGRAVAVAVVFVTLGLASTAVCADILKRSGQVVSNLRSIGASRGNILSAVAGSLLLYCALGSAIGAAAGAPVGAALAGSAAGTLVSALEIVAASTAAFGVGIFAGGRMTWRS